MSNQGPSIIASQQDVVETIDDVTAEWSQDVYNPQEPQPVIGAVQQGQLALCLAYQSASKYAKNQSDPSAATDEYLDEVGWERGVYRQGSELDGSYRPRIFNEVTVSPEEIIAVANAVLAPFTAVSCVYFEHSDAWFVRTDYLDIVGATNASPIQITVRFALPPEVVTGSTVAITNVAGNPAANASWTVTVTGTTTLTLNGSTGNGTYTGSGSLLPAADDPSIHTTQWSSHVFGTPHNTPNYPDRYYGQLPHRKPGGARAFTNPYGRIFWLLVPDISGIDTSVSALYELYLDVVSAVADPAGTGQIQLTTSTPLPSNLVTGSSVTTSLLLRYSTYPSTTAFAAAVGVFTITVTGPNTFLLNGTSMGSAVYAGGGSVQTTTQAPSDGFFLGSLNLPGQLLVPPGGTGTLDATHTVALVQTTGASTTVNLHSAPSANEQQAVLDVSANASQSPITVNGNGHNIQDPVTRAYGASVTLRTTNAFALWIFNSGTTQWDLYGQAATFLWSIAATANDVYSALVSAVESVRGHSMRWVMYADPKLGN